MDIIVGLVFWKAVEDMLEFEEYKVKLNNMKPTLDGLGSALKLDDARPRARKKVSGTTWTGARRYKNA